MAEVTYTYWILYEASDKRDVRYVTLTAPLDNQNAIENLTTDISESLGAFGPAVILDWTLIN